jgi:hypothetical protein
MARRQGIPSSKTSLKQQLGRVKVAKHSAFQSDKGKKAGSCNRRACQKPGAVFYNRGSYAYYCRSCADLINGEYRGDLGDEPLCLLDEEALELLMDKC